MKNKKVKKILILLVICILLLFSLLLFILFNSELKAQRELNVTLISNEMDEHLELPKGLYKLIEIYKGELTTEIISKQYNKIAKVFIPKYYEDCKNLNDSELNKYFNKNKKVIYIELGYETYEEFNKFIKELSNLTGNKLVFESYEIPIDSIEKTDIGYSAYISIKYENNETITFNSNISRKAEKDKTSILLNTSIDMEALELKREEREAKEKAEEEERVYYVEHQEVPKSGKVF